MPRRILSGVSGQVSENYDVLGRELMNEYEVRLLPDDECILFVRGEEALDYLKKQSQKNELIKISEIDAYTFMMMNLDELVEGGSVSGVSDKPGTGSDSRNNVSSAGSPEKPIDIVKLTKMRERIEKEREEEDYQAFLDGYDDMELFDMVVSEYLSPTRQRMIQTMLKSNPKPDESVILKIIDPRQSEAEMMRKWKAWEGMQSS